METTNTNANITTIPTALESEQARLIRSLPTGKTAIRYLKLNGADTEMLAGYDPKVICRVAKIAMAAEEADSATKDAAAHMGVLLTENPELAENKGKTLKALFPNMAYKTAMLYADVGVTVYAPYLNGDERYAPLYSLNPSVLQPLVATLKLEGGPEKLLKALPEPDKMTVTKLRETAKAVKAELKPKADDSADESSVHTEQTDGGSNETPVTLRRALMVSRTEEGETEILIPSKYLDFVKEFLKEAVKDGDKAKHMAVTLAALIK